MRYVLLLSFLAALALAAPAAGESAPGPKAQQICVGSGPKCIPNLATAIAAANDGDTIALATGTYAGGVTIDKSIRLVGAGAGQTIISGGGPVLTIGKEGASSEPTVSIQRVTVTGGVNSSVPSAFRAHGGGIYVPPNADSSGGATVTIKESVITGNRTAPTSIFPSPTGVTCPGGASCPFAASSGAGIFNDGAMTLIGTTVSGNHAGSAAGIASDVEGGGINTSVGSLTLIDSTVDGNSADALPPDGRFADGGGIFMNDNTTLSIHDSSVSDNSALLSATFPHPYPVNGDGSTDGMQSNGGGIHVSDGGSTVVEGSKLDDNTITVSDVAGEPVGFDAALCSCGENTLTLTNSTVDGNKVVADVGSQADVGPSGPAALEFDGSGTVSNSRINGNSTTVVSPGGEAEALGAVGGFQISPDTLAITNSEISGNTASASSTTGSATAQGAGLTNDGVLVLKDDRIANNSGVTSAPSGRDQGGGIFNGVVFGAPPVELTLQDTTVVGNALTGSPGVALQGGGLYTLGFPITLTNSPISRNAPDQCFGC
jgi:hypothetical protein